MLRTMVIAQATAPKATDLETVDSVNTGASLNHQIFKPEQNRL